MMRDAASLHTAGQPPFADSTRVRPRGPRPLGEERALTAEGSIRIALDLPALRAWTERRRRTVARVTRRRAVTGRCDAATGDDHTAHHLRHDALCGSLRHDRQRRHGGPLRLRQCRDLHRRATVRAARRDAGGRLHAHVAHAARKPPGFPSRCSSVRCSARSCRKPRAA